MRLRLPDGTVRTGRAIDLSSERLDPNEVVDAVRTDSGRDADCTDSAPDTGLCIECPEPGPGYDRLARIPAPNSPLSRGELLVAVGRSRELATPVDDDLARLEARLLEREPDSDENTATLPAPSASDLREARRRVAAAGDDESRLRERVATLRGRLNAHREADDEEAAAATQSELVEVATELSEVETERVAAKQRLDALERAARRARDGREERLRIRDAIANRRRELRAYLSTELGDEFDATVRELVADARGPNDFVRSATSGTGNLQQTVVNGLAAVRIAELNAPVVLMRQPFTDLETAVQWLGTPVITC
ncbi:hypothetical protein C440_08312 [Haloferax mucosum ATCC BAA-1512]|uniref:Uncharacterized protein n=1 Tax=Haloferax mucosum ATCC BAA-1512 TaxID=662479 RepID=M0IE72_9EURY|nr:hypothetical protein [Haloferax mucosum]ELZ95065.1 hypothetical protein C440_08312 [Haloferax mucosum ATCC BAA-1512]